MKKIYYGGDILTMLDTKTAPEAVVIEDGIIVYVGSMDDATKMFDDAEKINLNGHTLMPSFIDPHSHFMQTAQGISMCDLSGAESFDDIVTLLKEYKVKRNIEPGGIIFATGYDHNFLKEEKHPDKSVLDQASSEIPIYISHASGHMGVANSALLKIAKLPADAPDPNGGKFGRDEDGMLNGYVEETPALMPILAKAMPLLKIDMPACILETQQLYLQNGITTVQEGAAAKQSVAGLAAFTDAGMIQLDVIAYVMENDYEETIKAYPDRNNTYKNNLKIGGAKLILDGSPQGKSAWLSTPYEGESEYCGYPTHEDSHVTEVAQKAIQGGYQLLAHCNGDAASEQFLSCYEQALASAGVDLGKAKNLRPTMVHCQTVREDQLDRMTAINMLPTIFVGHVWYWGDIHYKNLGEKRASRISPVKSTLDRGMKFTFHQDTPVTAPNMLHSVWCAVNRITRNGRLLGEDQKISVHDALKAVTIHGAYAYHEEDIKGTIEVGKRADLVILDQNPEKVYPMDIRDIKVLETIKNGVKLYQL